MEDACFIDEILASDRCLEGDDYNNTSKNSTTTVSQYRYKRLGPEVRRRILLGTFALSLT
jgi:hypothetical protein